MVPAPDNEEFERLYVEHRATVYKYLLKLSRSADLAEDLSQDVFVRAHLKYDLFDPTRGSFQSWVLAMAHNLFINFIRKQARLNLQPADQIESNLTDTGNQADQIEDEILSARVRRIIEALPEPERSVFYLMKIKNWSREQIATKLGMSTRSVSRKLVNAIELLRGELVRAQLLPN